MPRRRRGASVSQCGGHAEGVGRGGSMNQVTTWLAIAVKIAAIVAQDRILSGRPLTLSPGAVGHHGTIARRGTLPATSTVPMLDGRGRGPG